MKSFTFLLHNLYHIGGTTRAVTTLANTLSERGHDVTILTVFKLGTTPAYPVNETINIQSIIDYSDKRNFVPLVYNRIRKYTPLCKPRIIMAEEPGIQQFSSYIEHKLIQAIQQVNTDYLVSTRASYNVLASEYANVETIAMEHMHFNAYSESVKQQLLKAYAHVDYVTTLTPQDQTQYKQYLPEDKVLLLPNIIPFDAHQATQRKQHKTNRITALGRFEHEKGFDLLIAAVSHIQHKLRDQQYTVHIYGSGSEKSNLQQQITNQQLSDMITLHDAINDTESVLNPSRITVIPSRSEGFGMVILEAMAANNAVVSFDAPIGPATLLTHGQNALVASCFDTESLANHIITAIEDASLREQLIAHGHETLKQYQPDAVYNKLAKQLPLT
ncbi:glycosyltransferase [Macrococcus capreoli]|uniref:glycosyltransferase n=1 Tax=Macrococcus capreoli TaxID=2982690 RepID=UPI0021D5DD3E|nr:glycosyltransferase [Macrococcus sp. TMW 2.2395]MCU7557519.1 glycosyltransferase [Macrococcus sp. TMW 2.2395]